ncbi:MAG: hypothetical protein U0R19_27140 [Bryobacteraceae bacterium]
MKPIADALQLLLAALDRMELRYAVGGSVASSEYGNYRYTNDVDILVEIESGQVGEFLELLGADFYAGGDTLGAIRLGRSANVIHIPTAYKFDIFPSGGREFPKRELDRRQYRNTLFGGSHIELSVVSPEDAILAKLDWMRQAGGVREQQRRDILSVISVQGEKLDFAYMEEMAEKLGVLPELKKYLQ